MEHTGYLSINLPLDGGEGIPLMSPSSFNECAGAETIQLNINSIEWPDQVELLLFAQEG